MSKITEDIVKDVKSDINEIKKDILPSSESQPVEEISGTPKKQKSLADKLLNSPYLKKNDTLDKIFNSGVDSKYQINNLLNYYKTSQIEFLYTLTSYFQFDNDNNIYISYPFSVLEQQITLYRNQFSEIESSIHNILLRNIISRRYINNIFDGAKIENMSEIDEKKIEDLVDGLKNIEIQSGGSDQDGNIFNKHLNASRKSLYNQITNSMVEFINFTTDVKLDRFVKEEIIIQEFTNVTKKALTENIIKGDFSLANFIMNANIELSNGVGNDNRNVIEGGSGNGNEVASRNGNEVDSMGQLVHPKREAAKKVASMFTPGTTVSSVTSTDIAAELATKVGYEYTDSRTTKKNFEELTRAVESMSTPNIYTFTIGADEVNNMIVNQMDTFTRDLLAYVKEGGVKPDQNTESIKLFAGRFRGNVRTFIFDLIVNEKDVGTINTALSEEGWSDSISDNEYKILRELVVTFEATIETDLQSIASDANGAMRDFIGNIRTKGANFEEVLMTRIQEVLGRVTSPQESELLGNTFNNLRNQFLEKINGTRVENGEAGAVAIRSTSSDGNQQNATAAEHTIHEMFEELADRAFKLQETKEMKLPDFDPNYLDGTKITVGLGSDGTKSDGTQGALTPVTDGTKSDGTHGALTPVTDKTRVTVTKPGSFQSGVPPPSQIAFESVANTPEYQSPQTQVAITRSNEIRVEITKLENETKIKQKDLKEIEGQLSETRDWVTRKERDEIMESIIKDNSDDSLMTKVKNALKDAGAEEKADSWSISFVMGEEKKSVTWTIPEGASTNINNLVETLNGYFGGSREETGGTKYEIIVDALTGTGSLLAPTTLTSKWTPEAIDDAVKVKNLPSIWFEKPTKKGADNKLDNMKIENFNVTTYKEASYDTQKKWIMANWPIIQKKHKDAQNKIAGDDYKKKLEAIITETGLIITNENKINEYKREQVDIQKKDLPALLKADVENLQKNTEKGKKQLIGDQAKDLMENFGIMREAIDKPENGITIDMVFDDEGGKRDYIFTISVYENDILSTLNSLKVTKSLLEIELHSLNQLKQVKDKDARYYDNVRDILSGLIGMTDAEILQNFDNQIEGIEKKLAGIDVSSKTLEKVYRNLGQFNMTGEGDNSKTYFSQLVNLNGTIPQFNDAVNKGYDTGMRLDQQKIIEEHRLNSGSFSMGNMLSALPEFNVDQFKEMYVTMAAFYNNNKLLVYGTGVTVGGIGYRLFDPTASLTTGLANFAVGVVQYSPVASVAYLGVDALGGIPNAYSGMGRQVLDYLDLEQGYNSVLYVEAGLISNLGGFPSLYSGDIDAGNYMNRMNRYRLTQYDALDFWNRIPTSDGNGTFIHHYLPPTTNDLLDYQRYGGFNTTDGFILNPNRGDIISFLPIPTNTTVPDMTTTDTTTISLAEQGNFALMENLNVLGMTFLATLMFLRKNITAKSSTKKKKAAGAAADDAADDGAVDAAGPSAIFSFWTSMSERIFGISSPDLDSVVGQLNIIQSRNNNYINAFNEKIPIEQHGTVLNEKTLKAKLYLTTRELIQLTIIKEMEKEDLSPEEKNNLNQILKKSNTLFKDEKTTYNEAYFVQQLLTDIPEGNVSLNIVNERLITLLESESFKAKEIIKGFKNVYGITSANLIEVTNNWITSEQTATSEQTVKKERPRQEDDKEEDGVVVTAINSIGRVHEPLPNTGMESDTGSDIDDDDDDDDGAAAEEGQEHTAANPNATDGDVASDDEEQEDICPFVEDPGGVSAPGHGVKKTNYIDTMKKYIVDASELCNAKTKKDNLKKLKDKDPNNTALQNLSEATEDVIDSTNTALTLLFDGKKLTPLRGGKKKNGSKKKKKSKKKGRKTKRKMYTKKKKGNSKKHKKKSKVKRNTRRK